MDILTRPDFDGILSACMIHDVEKVESINFTDPKTMEEGGILHIIDPGDIIAHLPVHPHAGKWFHNHETSHIDPRILENMKGKFGPAPSTARQVYDFYDSPDLKKYESLVQIADKIGSAQLTKEDVQTPTDWIMVSYTLDPRFSQDHNYAMLILDGIKGGKSAAEVLSLPAVAKRVELYSKDVERYIEELKTNTKMHGNVIVTDFRDVQQAPRGNRFAVFVMSPQGNVHVRLDALGGFRTKVSVSKSIFNRTCNVNIGQLLEEYGGGGMDGAGTCMLGRKTAPEKVPEIIKRLQG